MERRSSTRTRTRQGIGSPATPSKVQSKKNVKKSPTTRGKGKNNSNDLKNNKTRKIKDDEGEEPIKTEKDDDDEDTTKAVKDVEDSSELRLDEKDKDEDIYGVHEELNIKNDVEELIENDDEVEDKNEELNIKNDEDEEEQNKNDDLEVDETTFDIPKIDSDNISQLDDTEEIQGVPDLNISTVENPPSPTPVENPHDKNKPTSPPPIESPPSPVHIENTPSPVPIENPPSPVPIENPPSPVHIISDTDHIESVSPLNVVDVEKGEDDSSIVIPDDDDDHDDDIILTYEDMPPKSKNNSSIDLRGELIELDRVGQVDDNDKDDDIVTIIDEDEDVLQDLENMRSEGQGSERDSLLNITRDSVVSSFGDNDYGFSDEEIELSGDEEEDFHRQDVTMMLIKRPPLITETVEVYDILDSDEEFPVCLAEGEKTDPVNIEEKWGEVKEYIEEEGLGMIFSKEFGLILFHVENVWINGDKYNPVRTRSKLPVGSAVSFYDQTFEGEEYEALSKNKTIHQAVAVWVGMRVEHLLKKTSAPSYKKKLEESRNSFMELLTHDVFMRVAQVRAKAKVAGYLTDEVGILLMWEEGRGFTKKVLFHTKNVIIYKKPLNHYVKKFNVDPKKLLPVGLNLSIDARKLATNGVREVEYQAIYVLAGSWPNTIHPTLVPGGLGSVVPSDYPVPDHHTYFYFDTDLEARLQHQVHNFQYILDQTGGEIRYDTENSTFIKGPHDAACWKEQFTGIRPENQHKRRDNREREKKEVGHLFKAPPPRKPIVIIKKQEEDETESLAATAGGSRAGSVSGAGSAFSRPCSGLSMSSRSSETGSGKGMSRSSSHRSTTTTRNWYKSSNYHVGGLRVKNEVKSELEDEEGPSPPKRIKTELMSIF